MNLTQTVSKILGREVTEQEAMEFALNQYGVLTTFNREWEARTNPTKEIRVYAIDVTLMDIGAEDLTDEEYFEECEKQGGVYSLAGFEKAFNQEEINSSTFWIKIV